MGLTELSRRYPNMLLVAGSIAWEKNINVRRQYEGSKEFVKVGIARGKFPKAEDIADRLEDGWGAEYFLNSRHGRGSDGVGERRRAKYIQSIRMHADDRNKPSSYKGELHARNSERKKLHRLAREDSRDDAKVARNTAYIFINGLRVHKYHKRSEYAEVLNYNKNDNRLVHVPGHKEPVFTLGSTR